MLKDTLISLMFLPGLIIFILMLMPGSSEARKNPRAELIAAGAIALAIMLSILALKWSLTL